jgi:hypothetical protein
MINKGREINQAAKAQIQLSHSPGAAAAFLLFSEPPGDPENIDSQKLINKLIQE